MSSDLKIVGSAIQEGTEPEETVETEATVKKSNETKGAKPVTATEEFNKALSKANLLGIDGANKELLGILYCIDDIAQTLIIDKILIDDDIRISLGRRANKHRDNLYEKLNRYIDSIGKN